MPTFCIRYVFRIISLAGWRPRQKFVTDQKSFFFQSSSCTPRGLLLPSASTRHGPSFPQAYSHAHAHVYVYACAHVHDNAYAFSPPSLLRSLPYIFPSQATETSNSVVPPSTLPADAPLAKELASTPIQPAIDFLSSTEFKATETDFYKDVFLPIVESPFIKESTGFTPTAEIINGRGAM